MLMVDGEGVPIGYTLDSAQVSELVLAPTLLDRRLTKQTPDRLVADMGYDSNPFRAQCVERGMEPIVPAKSTNYSATHQDGRKLRRYAHRWIMERSFAWLNWFRRLIVRHEHHLEMYEAFFVIGCSLIVMNRVLE